MEVYENVKRLRHHACLGLWCGNNEIESAWCHWDGFQKESMYLRADYIRLFEGILAKTVKQTDPDTFFWPSSPSSGGCLDELDAENRGDYWDVWHGQKPFTGCIQPQYSEKIVSINTESYYANGEEIFIELQVETEDGKILTDVETILPYKYLVFPKADVQIDVKETIDAYQICLSADGFLPFVELDFAEADVIFEDNYFHITSSHPYIINVKKSDIIRGSFIDVQDMKKRIKLCTLAQTY
ncbi:MAG: glycoside hydrolase family 2 protein [Candidatus Fimimorpha sp.]